jgi:hypothetical protein
MEIQVSKMQLSDFKDKKTVDCTDEEVKASIKEAILIVGLSTKAISEFSDIEKIVLINFIRSQYPKLTLKDFVDAFYNAAAQKLNVDTRCYGNFCCEYVGRILSAYINSGIIQELNRVKPQDYFNTPKCSIEAQISI